MTDAAAKVDAKRGFPWRKAVQGFNLGQARRGYLRVRHPEVRELQPGVPILKSLSAAQILWLALAQFLNSATYWTVYVAALPGLRFWPSAVLIQTNSAIASVLPAGGAFAVGITYKMLGS